MTALAGLWRFDDRPDAADGCARMLAAQKLYGPHSGAQWSDRNVVLGRQLMRVLPEDSFDRQPLVAGGGRYVLVADIRLDNRDELIETLKIAPVQARNLCDAAILLAAIERWDETCLDHLVGDYAFALWDSVRHHLLLARDPLGQRPLHYHRSNAFFAFASMPKGLHALAEVPYAPDDERIADFLVLMPETGPRSFFRDIEQVEPGHVAIVTANRFVARRHWQPGRRRITLHRPEEYSETLRDLLDQAVRCRLRGAQNVGAHLSGGFDSAAVVSSAAKQLAPSCGRVIAFTSVPREGFDGPAPRNRITDEGPYAAATADLYPNIEHVLVRSNGRSPLDNLDRNFFLFDRPTLNICNDVWLNSISDAAHERKLAVMLTGDTGNVGLSYNGLELLPELLRKGCWLRWWREAHALIGPGRMRWRGVLATTFGPWCPARLWVWLNRVANGCAYDVSNYSGIHPDLLAQFDLLDRMRARNLDLVYRPWKDSFAVRLWVLQRVDLGNYNTGVLGGWHIDLRDPTADVRLLEFCLSVPTDQFLQKGVNRALARRVLADRLPRFVLDEPRKGIQAADWYEGLTAARDSVAAELDRITACPAAARALDLPRLRRLVENWPSGGWERNEVINHYRLALLRAISTGHFLRRATGGNF